ncbi:MAG TPA: DUF1592 domain-containing protein [Candidatus Limnocylindria bacterium]|jgi:hypothetical protein|nr:DUF1592 domain-containing protein [Candidatus Limnocylindria bacterium]
MGAFLVASGLGSQAAPESAGAVEFREHIQPLLKEYCYDCHGDGASKGHVAFDAFDSPAAALEAKDIWWRALKNLRSGIMPPPKKPQPTARQKEQIERWIKSASFAEDPLNPDPGHVTVRRLNRTEYRNTIRDLVGVDFEVDKEFPPDDSGLGFDNIGDALTLPPMLLEKYLTAAKAIVSKAVPSTPRVPAEAILAGKSFKPAANQTASTSRTNTPPPPGSFSYYEHSGGGSRFHAEHAGKYQLLLDFSAVEKFVDNQFDYNQCRWTFKADGKELFTKEFGREGNRPFHFEFDQTWDAGDHDLVFEIEPLTPDKKQVRALTMRVDSVTVRGPLESGHWVQPANYITFFPKPVPAGSSARRRYAKELLTSFATKAYRRPVDRPTVDRLAALAEGTYGLPGKTFEEGVSQAMVAVLASPRFLFREEGLEKQRASTGFPLIDEYALATRLSYLFWSSMPDETLLRLAGESKLRANLAEQSQRLLADPKSAGFIKNFSGQWLQTRDVDTVQIDARSVLGRETSPDPEFEKRRQRFRDLRDKGEDKLAADEKKEIDDLRAILFRPNPRPLRAELNGDLRRAMRLETEKTFEYIVRQDRPLLELLDSDYTFLNERLARHYSLTNLNIVGDEMRLVKLPADSMRGGVITHGSVLTVTSNPTRTSPVKRGKFILDNLLGSPPPPPPPDIPPLEDAAKAIKDRVLTLRETLALHREQPLCSSCHNRMDPLGLALDNFNAMGMWRDQEKGQPIDAAGILISGEKFTDIKQLKHVLVTEHATEFYRTITEKLLTYALGRGLEYYDVATVDAIVARLEKSNGKASVLLSAVIESAPFQKSRPASANPPSKQEASLPKHPELKASP